MNNLTEQIKIVKDRGLERGCTNRCLIKGPRPGSMVTNGTCDCVKKAAEFPLKRLAIEQKLRLCDNLIAEYERSQREHSDMLTEITDASRL